MLSLRCADATDCLDGSRLSKSTSIVCPAKKTGLHATTSLRLNLFQSSGRIPREPVRKLSLVRWGLIPSWAKDMSGAARMINARSETAAKTPAFRDAMKSRRCLIPADGFYEWQRIGKAKQPYCFEIVDGKLFAFAGLWDRWKDPSGNMGQVLLDSDDDSERGDISSSRPDARHPQSRWLRPVARSGYDKYGCCV